MTFPEALSATFNDNARITRRAWHSLPLVYVFVIEGKLCITGFSDKDDGDKRPHPLIVTEQDYFAGDWEIIE